MRRDSIAVTEIRVSASLLLDRRHVNDAHVSQRGVRALFAS